MTLEMNLQDKLDEGIEIGKAEGIEIGEAKGIEIGKAENLRELVAKKMSKGLSEQEALDILSISVTEYEEAKKILAERK